MRNSTALISLLVVLFYSSCKPDTRQLVIQNVSEKDSLIVVVKINDKKINDTVLKAVTNIFYNIHQFDIDNDSAIVEVILPQLGISKTESGSLKRVENIFVTIKSVPVSFIPVKGNDLQTIPTKLEILISFAEKRSEKKAL